MKQHWFGLLCGLVTCLALAFPFVRPTVWTQDPPPTVSGHQVDIGEHVVYQTINGERTRTAVVYVEQISANKMVEYWGLGPKYKFPSRHEEEGVTLEFVWNSNTYTRDPSQGDTDNGDAFRRLKVEQLFPDNNGNQTYKFIQCDCVEEE